MALYKRGATWWYSFEFEGRRIQESSGFKNKTAAGRAEANRKSDLLNGRAGFSPKAAQTQRFDEAVASFKEWSKAHHRPKTHDLHTINCSTLLRYFGGKWLDAITPEMVENFRAARLRETRWNANDGSTVSPSTVNRALATLRLIYNCMEMKSSTRKGMFAREEGQTRVITVAEEVAYLGAASQPLRDIATIILHTGMSPDEVFRVELQNVDLRRKTIFNPWGKTRAAKRIVHLDEEAFAILKRRVENAQHAGSPYIFWSKGRARPEKKDRPIGSVRKAQDESIARAELQDFRVYDLRQHADFWIMPSLVGLLFCAPLLALRSALC